MDVLTLNAGGAGLQLIPALGEAVARFLTTQGAYWHAQALREVATAFARVRSIRSAELFKDAHRVANSIEGQEAQVNGMQALAAAMAAARDERADQVFGDAYQAASRFKDSGQRIRALTDLAVAMAQAGNARSSHVFAEARAAASRVGRASFSRDLALNTLSVALASAERYEDARETAAGIQDDSLKANTLCQVATTMAQAGDDQARQVFDAAQAAANGISMDESREKHLQEVATAQANTGFFSEALATLGLRKLDDCLLVLAEWAPVFERRERGLLLEILREGSGVAGWLRTDWRSIHELSLTSSRE